MADYLKKPLFNSLNAIAAFQAKQAIERLGYGLPCTVASVVSSGVVTVNFEVDASPATLPQLTVPIEYPEYIRYPIQVGDKGMVLSASVRLGGVTGLGSGIPPLNSLPGNLGALSFVWLGNTAWSATDDPKALVMYGPNGVVLRDSGSAVKFILTPQGVTIDGPLTVNGSITATGDVTANSISLETHVHGGVQSGSSDTGPPA